MTNFNKNARLTNVRPYQDVGNNWFLELTYNYDADDGEHTLIIPKVRLPFTEARLPMFKFIANEGCVFYGEDVATIETIGYSSYGDTQFFSGVVTDPRNGEQLNACMYADILVKPKVREMTLEEIEKKLGYKVKVVAKKGD